MTTTLSFTPFAEVGMVASSYVEVPKQAEALSFIAVSFSSFRGGTFQICERFLSATAYDRMGFSRD